MRDQLVAQQKHLLRVEEMQCSEWLICQSTSKFVARQVVSLMKNDQQSQNLLLKVDPRSTFRNNVLQPARDDRHFRLKAFEISGIVNEVIPLCRNEEIVLRVSSSED